MTASALKMGPLSIVAQTNKVHTGTVIFLHGSGDTGAGLKEWIRTLLGKDFMFRHLRVLFPTSPVRPYTPSNGMMQSVWFDRMKIAPNVPEHLETIDPMGKELAELILKEVAAGIPQNRILIGGFSMGGAMAMHVGYRLLPQVAGVFALSSFLNNNSVVYEALKSKMEYESIPPLFMCHGDRDTLVPPEWGEITFKNLDKLGVLGQFHTLNNTFHELKRGELLDLYNWINECLPIEEGS